MLEIISHTPNWVIIVFFILVILGFMQSKQRVVKANAIFILPVAMVVFSLFGVYSVFSITPLSIGIWSLGFVLTLLVGLKLACPKAVSFSEKNNKLTIPGSWIPLLLMMAIFFTKYFVGFAVARDLAIMNELVFVVLISLLYGVFSGLFLSRSFIMFKSIKSDS